MKNGTIPACLPYKKKYTVLGSLEVDLDITGNDLGLPIEALLSMAARRNKKRSFLFVSKLLGKHLPVPPQIPVIGGHLLAHMFLREIEQKEVPYTGLLANTVLDYGSIQSTLPYIKPGMLEVSTPTLFIGFAETATGLGHSMYSAFADNTGYIHTTRDTLKEATSAFTFEEVHSHDTFHACYASAPSFIDRFDRIVLVDDEITTGRTSLNLIRALNKKHPGKTYVVASFLDWRSEEDMAAFKQLEEELSVRIGSVSFVKGKVHAKGSVDTAQRSTVPYTQQTDIKNETICIHVPSNIKSTFTFVDGLQNETKLLYLKANGRFGITSKDNPWVEKLIEDTTQVLKPYRGSGKCLCLGFNEFIYLPARIASNMGEGVSFHSTTRSPIHPSFEDNYCIQAAIPFKNPYDSTVQNYCYNILPSQYEEVFIFFERDIPETSKNALAEALSKLGVHTLRFVVFG